MLRQRPKPAAAEALSEHATAIARPTQTTPRKALSPSKALVCLLVARLLSAALNLIHDCDETFNYLEPLHFLVHGSGMQTWEYSANFALRPYLYLLLHAVVAAPATVLGCGRGKVLAFYCIKAALGAVSAATEALLYRAVSRHFVPAVAHALLLFLCVTSGMFVASTGVLPSSFTMYTLTAAAAYVLEDAPYPVILWAATGIIWGWSVAAMAFLPYALWVLLRAPLGRAVLTALLSLLGTLGPLVLVDRWYYGRWTNSLWNFIVYNVAGGGDSALYGVEGPYFYLRNAFNNFQLLLPLALAALPLLLYSGRSIVAAGNGSSSSSSNIKAAQAAQAAVVRRLLVALSPLYIWLAAITALPHKEERFFFVVYPLVCLAAAAALAIVTLLAHRLLRQRPLRQLADSTTLVNTGLGLFLLGSCALALSRSAALVLNYGAPLRLYTHLPEVRGPGSPINVCVGAEWHRFPSAFFLPGERYRLQFIKSGFTGLLPRPFDAAEGGTRAAPASMNDRNQAAPSHYWTSTAACDYIVTLREADKYIDSLGRGPWEEVASLPFVDVAQSPAVTRAFYIPWLSRAKNKRVDYVLLRKGSKRWL